MMSPIASDLRAFVFTPSPGTPGEGGVRVRAVDAVRQRSINCANPHPASPGVPGEVKRQTKGRRRSGVTLVEISIVIIIIGILVAFVVPSFTRVSEQNHVDAAAQYLRSIWSAQRVYWLENKSFASSLDDLRDLGLIDSKIADGSDGYFNYTISAASSDAFTITAQRTGSGVWGGALTITQTGDVTGFVSKSGGTVLAPPDI